MRVIQINSVPYGSTGKIMFSISDILLERKDESICATGFSWHSEDRNDYWSIGTLFSKAVHMYMSKLLGDHGRYSKNQTKKLINKIKNYSPDVIHLHNIHGWYIHIPTLFNYLKESHIPVVWTLHDCWAFTGGCSHFTFSKCRKWVECCGGCTNLIEYPISSKVDKTRMLWHMKERYFCELTDLTIVTPSEWLKGLLEQSFLKKYPTKVINNGINLDIFQPVSSTFKETYNIANEQYIVLGVSLGWNNRKGLDVFIELSKRLPREYKIVLVGTDDKIDTMLPNNIISVHRTQNQFELAGIYSSSDIFVNPTREENFPTVNIESLACGTPVLTFNTGGSPEIIDENCGSVIECDDIDALESEIVRICTKKPYSIEACIKKSREFDQKERFKEYIELYEEIIATRNKRS